MSEKTWLQRAVDMFDNDRFKDGDLLSRDWIAHALDIPPIRSVQDAERVQWMTLARVEAFKEYLLVERKVALRTARGQGYVVIPPSEQAEFAAREAMGLVQKGLRKGAKIMENTRLDALTDSQKRRHTDAELRLSGLSQMMKRQRRDVFRLFKSQELEKCHE